MGKEQRIRDAQMTPTNDRRICVGRKVGFITSALVFLLVYAGVWSVLRRPLAAGLYGAEMTYSNMRSIADALSEFFKQHGHYPDSLDQLAGIWYSRLTDQWGNRFHYEKTEEGFRLLSLGRDGELGGVGLDADYEYAPASSICIEPTLLQFLLDLPLSGHLFVIASLAGLCAGRLCYVIDREYPIGHAVVSTIIVTTFAAYVVFFLVFGFWLAGDR